MYGNKIEHSIYTPQHDVLAMIETTGSGNTVLVIGKETPSGDGWFQRARVVLTLGELAELAEQLTRLAGQANS